MTEKIKEPGKTKEPENTELVPKKGSEGVGIAITEMMEQILTYRDDILFPETCVRYYKLKQNEHWKYVNKNLKLISCNMLGSHHQKTVNMLTDNNPTFNAVPGGELGDQAEEKLSLLENVVDAWWLDMEQQAIFEQSVHMGELYGTVAEYVYFDKNMNFPTGEVRTKPLDIMYVSLYPPKCRTIEDAEAVLMWEPMSVRKVKRDWPKVADEVKSDMSLLEKIGDDRDEDTKAGSKSAWTVISSIWTRVTKSNKKSSDTDTDETFIITAWVKDYSTKNGKPVYPGNIRRIRCISGGSIVLDDDYNPSLNPAMSEEELQSNYLYNRLPFSYTQPLIDPSSPFGMADFKQLEKLNIEFNENLTRQALFTAKTSRSKLLNPKDSGVSNEELNNSPTGIVRPTNYLVAQAMKYIDPPQQGADIYTGLNLYKDLFNEIAGSFNDVMQGQKHGSEVIAAKAIAMLLEEASRMARGKIRNYSKMLRERGRMFVALAQNWYAEPRFITFQKGGQDQTISVDRKMLQIAGKINIVSGSTMPVSNIQRREEVLSLAKGNFVDQEYVLEKFNVDGYKDIIKRMQQGPLGQYLQKLSMIGIPPQILQLFQQIGQMDEKQIEKGLEMGKIPPFMKIIQSMSGQQQETPPDPAMVKIQMDAQMNDRKIKIEEQKLMVDAEKAKAEIQKIITSSQKEQAEIELIKQKIESEITDRQIRVIGVELDRENIRIEKAKAVASIQQSKKSQQIETTKVIAGLHGQKHKESMDMRQDKGGYDEVGMKSNNKVTE